MRDPISTFVSIVGYTYIFIAVALVGGMFPIVILGLTMVLVALQGDVSWSTDHPLVKAQGLNL